MRVAVFHNLPFGGALRSLGSQVSRLGELVAATYTFAHGPNRDQPAPGSVEAPPLRLRKPPGSPFGRLGGLVNILNLMEVKRANRLLAARIDGDGYDVVFVHSCAVTQTPPVLQYLKTPTVYYCPEPFRAMHEALIKGGVFVPASDPLRSLYTRLAILNECAGMKAATRVLCNSCYTREYILRSYGVNAEVNYRGVDLARFRPLGGERENRVLSVGRLSPLKGHDFAIESLAEIDPKDRPSLAIVCEAGNTAYKPSLQALADRLGVSVTFHEGISDERLCELYSGSLATLSAPILEPLGLVALESMACGTPVIGVAEAGVRETVVDGVTGYLTHRDTRQFAAAIARLLGDPKLAAEMGRAAREHVEKNWNWHAPIARLEAILREVGGKAN